MNTISSIKISNNTSNSNICISNAGQIYNPCLSSNLQTLSNYGNSMIIQEGDVLFQRIQNNKNTNMIKLSGRIFTSNQNYLENLGMKVEYINFPSDITRISWPK